MRTQDCKKVLFFIELSQSDVGVSIKKWESLKNYLESLMKLEIDKNNLHWKFYNKEKVGGNL